jgi:hypothetical protein
MQTSQVPSRLGGSGFHMIRLHGARFGRQRQGLFPLIGEAGRPTIHDLARLSGRADKFPFY